MDCSHTHVQRTRNAVAELYIGNQNERCHKMLVDMQPHALRLQVMFDETKQNCYVKRVVGSLDGAFNVLLTRVKLLASTGRERQNFHTYARNHYAGIHYARNHYARNHHA